MSAIGRFGDVVRVTHLLGRAIHKGGEWEDTDRRRDTGYALPSCIGVPTTLRRNRTGGALREDLLAVPIDSKAFVEKEPQRNETRWWRVPAGGLGVIVGRVKRIERGRVVEQSGGGPTADYDYGYMEGGWSFDAYEVALASDGKARIVLVHPDDVVTS